MKDKAKSDLKNKVIYEMKLFFVYAAFLTLFFWSFAVYKQLILAKYEISYYRYGYNLLEGLILAKIILIGQSIGLGERYLDKPLIYPTLYKTLIFSLFVMAFEVVEHFIIGGLHGRAKHELYQEFLTLSINQILAKALIMFFMFFFFFAFFETGRALGDNKLFNLFFKKR